MSFIHRSDDGIETDVTADIGSLFDLVIGSMDWGSGFLTYEDAEPVVRIGQLGGFKDAGRAQDYIDDKAQCEEQAAYLAQHPDASALIFSPRASVANLVSGGLSPLGGGERVPHDHVFSSVGRCMWRWCSERRAVKS